MKHVKRSVILLATLLLYTMSVTFAFEYFFNTEPKLVNSGLTITPTADYYYQTRFSLSQETSTNLTELQTVQASQGKIENVTTTGDLDCILNFTCYESVTIQTGAFSGQGFAKGNWSATIGNLTTQGTWTTYTLVNVAERKIYHKGAISGDTSGTTEGYVFESVNGSGVYDLYCSTWKLNRIGSDPISAAITLNGTISYINSTTSPSTLLFLRQTTLKGSAWGYYTGPLSLVVTWVEIEDENCTYHGEGFSKVSYMSSMGSGEGWMYSRLVSPGSTGLNGVFTEPVLGDVSSSFNENGPSKTMTGTIRRLDVGLPPQPKLDLKAWGPRWVSPGQTVTYLIELRNDGWQDADNVSLIYLPPFLTRFISASETGYYDGVMHIVRWNFTTITAKTSMFLSIQLEVFWGLQSGTKLPYSADAIPRWAADTIWGHASPSLTKQQNEMLHIIDTGGEASGPSKLCEPVSIKEYFGVDFCQDLQPVINYINARMNRAEFVGGVSMELELAYLEQHVLPLLKDLQNDPEKLSREGKSFKQEILSIGRDCGYRVPNDGYSEIRQARDPNAKYGPTRYVVGGQMLNYTIEYENEGEGIAFGVYITDTLTENLDASTLVVGQNGIYDPSTRTITWSIGEVGSHEKGNVTYNVNVVNDASIGTEIVNYATVYFPSVPETTRTNGVVNMVSYPHDVAVLDIEPSRILVGQSHSLSINVTLENQGVNNETFNVKVFANTTALQSRNLTSESGQFSISTFTWNTTGFAYGNYTISVCVEPIPGEVDIADNNLTGGWVLVSIPGDINFDRKVDLKDVFAVGKAFGAALGDSRYNQNLDINGDGKIDLKDYFTACKNFGKSW